MEINRFDELIQALEKSSDIREIRFDIEGLTDNVMQDLLGDMAGQAPEGQPDERRMETPERASIRQHAQTLISSWDDEPEINQIGDGVSFSIGLDHPTYDSGDEGILEWLRFGTYEHPVPTKDPDGLVSFWWGAPLPWAPSRAPATDHAPGLFFFPGTEHHGAEGFDWIDPLIEQALPELEAAADLVGEKYAFSILSGLSFLNRRGA